MEALGYIGVVLAGAHHGGRASAADGGRLRIATPAPSEAQAWRGCTRFSATAALIAVFGDAGAGPTGSALRCRDRIAGLGGALRSRADDCRHGMPRRSAPGAFLAIARGCLGIPGALPFLRTIVSPPWLPPSWSAPLIAPPGHRAGCCWRRQGVRVEWRRMPSFNGSSGAAISERHLPLKGRLTCALKRQWLPGCQCGQTATNAQVDSLPTKSTGRHPGP